MANSKFPYLKALFPAYFKLWTESASIALIVDSFGVIQQPIYITIRFLTSLLSLVELKDFRGLFILCRSRSRLRRRRGLSPVRKLLFLLPKTDFGITLNDFFAFRNFVEGGLRCRGSFFEVLG